MGEWIQWGVHKLRGKLTQEYFIERKEKPPTGPFKFQTFERKKIITLPPNSRMACLGVDTINLVMGKAVDPLALIAGYYLLGRRGNPIFWSQ